MLRDPFFMTTNQMSCITSGSRWMHAFFVMWDMNDILADIVVVVGMQECVHDEQK